MTNRKISAVFLDRDGVINEKIEGGFVKVWDEFKFLPDTASAIKLLNDKKIPVYLISNQSGIGRGIMSHNDLEKIHRIMTEFLSAEGAHLDDIFVCPHAPDENCDCRKPKPGLLLQAKKKHPEIEFINSWFIGDSGSDVAAGSAVKCRTYQLKSTENLLEVTRKILEKQVGK
ncbi:HAD family hydrolase [Candidatus Saganbacteria bacterium]|nr:HAD family hydrolase [Candidatus Saganbacteria bacterium]